MAPPPSRETALLRTLLSHLERRPLAFERLTQDILLRERIAYARQRADGITAIRMPGYRAFIDLTAALLDRFPEMERGAFYDEIQTEMLSYMETYLGREPSALENVEAEALAVHFEKWFADKASSRHVFVPCAISRTPAPRFEIGPVTFDFIDRVTTSDFCRQDCRDAPGFHALVRWMREQDADWLARVTVDGCEQRRAQEIAELAVDLVIVALQLAAPNLDTRNMTRLDARRGTSQKHTLSEAHGHYNAGWTRKEPGMAIGHGTLADILEKTQPTVRAVGNVVRSFASGSFRLPVLERAWCDAAYWFHQALAESIGTIAVAKLETALEVLVRSENSTGSKRRVLEILNIFYGLGPDDTVSSGSLLSVREFARNVVRDRSRILHGTWSTLNARGIERAGMEGFVSNVLRTAVIELEAYARSTGPNDNIDEFLLWVQQRKMTSAPPET
jgi:hypothetical protein